MRIAATRLLRLSTCLVFSYLFTRVTRAAPPGAGPATAPATQPAVVPELETRTGAFVPEVWGPLPDRESRRLVELVVKRGGAPLRVVTREELWKRGRKVEAEFPQEVPPTRGGGGRGGAGAGARPGAGAGGGAAAGKPAERPKKQDLFNVEPAATFQVYVPESYRPGRLYGLLVWNSAGPRGGLPGNYQELCDKFHLIAVGPDEVGNSVYVPWRRYRALEAVAQARRHFTIDDQRVYATGGSGGGRISSQVGVLYADVFTGAFPLIGCDPYVPAPAGGGNRFYNGFWPNPDGTIIKRARNDNRYALLTGTKDPNQFNTLCVFNLYKSLGFAHVTYYEVPDMGHQIPPADWFEKGLNDLDGPLGDALPLYLSAPNLEKQHKPGEAYLAYARAAARGGKESFVPEAEKAADALYKQYTEEVARIAQLVKDGPAAKASLQVKLFRTQYAPLGDEQAAAFEEQLKPAPKAVGGKGNPAVPRR